ncbi:MAG: hypothetical protein P4L83_11960 [Nevskia sp.]|nr:hypothetical protein [Nevskia sp.]
MAEFEWRSAGGWPTLNAYYRELFAPHLTFEPMASGYPEPTPDTRERELDFNWRFRHAELEFEVAFVWAPGQTQTQTPPAGGRANKR